MNYRHAFHAGNFADLVKHAALTDLVATLLADPEPLQVVDTHAGAGLYDLTDGTQARSREAEAGVARLKGAGLPPEFAGLAAGLEALNGAGEVRTYPGSPWLVLSALRPDDRLDACELRPDDFERLNRLFAGAAGKARAHRSDGFAFAEAAAARPGRLLVHIDPPFERADDYLRIAETVGAVIARKPEAVILVWLPIKDLETLDAFARRLEALDLPRVLIAEARLRPLTNPMKLNGCALAAINAPQGYAARLEAICRFVVENLGEAGGRAKVWSIPA